MTKLPSHSSRQRPGPAARGLRFAASLKALLAFAVVCVSALSGLAASTINSANAFSWGANVGWMNWQGDGANGAVIGQYVLGGYIYGANVGWINLGNYDPPNHIQYQNSSAGDFGVNVIYDPTSPSEARLRGYAWGANIGWINFEDTGNPRLVFANGVLQLQGYAYGANVGWINLGDGTFFVQTDTIAPGIDTDGNGIADAFEQTVFGTIGVDPNADPDADGLTNLQEYQAGTSPVFPDARLLNISTRLRVLTGDNVLIGGFIITGNDPKKVIVRAIGPSLGAAGVQDVLADPVLELHDVTGALVAFNDNWRDSQEADVNATGIPPTDDFESAIVQTLAPGAYTAILRGNNDAIGIGLVEAYDLDQTVASKLANISTRGFVDIGDNVLIGGFIIGGNSNATPRVVIRAIGPSLANSGINGALQDPTLELHDVNGTTLAGNDNWREFQQTELEATGVPPQDDRESAMVVSLAPGPYTAIVRGKDGTTGVGLVEVYNVP